ncbi:MAG TPA: hypothetical protein VJ935_01490 [Acidimicrobiia bacterium]|nr:hypothetical protein [Acidimicrobiia bacterium]
MSWTIRDERNVEQRIRAFGEDVWAVWIDEVKPHLVEDPSPTNSNLHFDSIHEDQLRIGSTTVAVQFVVSGSSVYLFHAVDTGDDSHEDN